MEANDAATDVPNSAESSDREEDVGVIFELFDLLLTVTLTYD